jgi:hypothetical protein
MDHTSIALKVLRRRWEDTYEWKAREGVRVMSGLMRNPTYEGEMDELEDVEENNENENEEENDENEDPDEPKFIVTEYPPNSESPRTYTLGVESFEVTESLPPLEEYIAGMAPRRGNAVEGDPDNNQFLPYTDDTDGASSDCERHPEEYELHSGEGEPDPDGKLP